MTASDLVVSDRPIHWTTVEYHNDVQVVCDDSWHYLWDTKDHVADCDGVLITDELHKATCEACKATETFQRHWARMVGYLSSVPDFSMLDAFNPEQAKKARARWLKDREELGPIYGVKS